MVQEDLAKKVTGEQKPAGVRGVERMLGENRTGPHRDAECSSVLLGHSRGRKEAPAAGPEGGRSPVVERALACPLQDIGR